MNINIQRLLPANQIHLDTADDSDLQNIYTKRLNAYTASGEVAIGQRKDQDDISGYLWESFGHKIAKAAICARVSYHDNQGLHMSPNIVISYLGQRKIARCVEGFRDECLIQGG